jgi:hypothetical protein
MGSLNPRISYLRHTLLLPSRNGETEIQEFPISDIRCFCLPKMGSLRTESLYFRACVGLPPQDGEGDRVAVEGLGPINKEESEDE